MVKRNHTLPYPNTFYHINFCNNKIYLEKLSIGIDQSDLNVIRGRLLDKENQEKIFYHIDDNLFFEVDEINHKNKKIIERKKSRKHLYGSISQLNYYLYSGYLETHEIMSLTHKLGKIIDKESDSIMIFKSIQKIKNVTLGVEKGSEATSNVL